MAALRQVIQELGLDRRTCDYCVKCDLGYQERFDNADPPTRQSFIEALATCNRDDFMNPLPVLGLITLLSESEFEGFITRLAKRAPFDASLAWDIIRLSSHGVGAWFTERGKAKFQRRFHLHPILAPLLIQAAIRHNHEKEDIVALFDCYESVAQEHTVLRNALPLWQAELERRKQNRIAQEEAERVARLHHEAEQAEWTRNINAITYEGPAAILRALQGASLSDAKRFPRNWAQISAAALRGLHPNLLAQALPALNLLTKVRSWRSLAHKVQSALQTHQRAAVMNQLTPFPLSERLQSACDSRWSLTYFPGDWAEEVLADTTTISPKLQTLLLSKLKRLQQRCPWRTLRQELQRKEHSI